MIRKRKFHGSGCNPAHSNHILMPQEKKIESRRLRCCCCAEAKGSRWLISLRRWQQPLLPLKESAAAMLLKNTVAAAGKPRQERGKQYFRWSTEVIRIGNAWLLSYRASQSPAARIFKACKTRQCRENYETIICVSLRPKVSWRWKINRVLNVIQVTWIWHCLFTNRGKLTTTDEKDVEGV